MKKFKEFIKKSKHTLITVDPIHGSHSGNKEPVLVTAKPTHGKHSQVDEEVKFAGAPESLADFRTHNANPHLGTHVDAAGFQLEHSHNLDELPHKRALKDYSYDSTVNGHLIAKAKGVDYYHPDHKAHSTIKGLATPKEWESYTKRLPKMKRAADEQIKHMDSNLKTHKLDHDLNVFHGLGGWHPGHEASKSPTRTVKLPGYTSTSLNPNKGFSFAKKQEGIKHILHIHLKKGQSGTYFGTRSEYPEEHEMLLPRNAVLKIGKHPDKYQSGPEKTHVWHAHVVGHED